jgi:hypothetical protein
MLNPLLVEIERWVLPCADQRYLPPNQRSQREANHEISPDGRLESILHQVAVSEHLCSMQTWYGDSEDEQRLAPELREGDSQNTVLPTAVLMEKLAEGRCRAVALCRICFGEESVESIRALLDLANAYALQGMWAQVQEHVTVAMKRLARLTNPASEPYQEYIVKRQTGRLAAARIDCCFRVLRTHALANRGQITTSFLHELLVELGSLPLNASAKTRRSTSPKSSPLTARGGNYTHRSGGRNSPSRGSASPTSGGNYTHRSGGNYTHRSGGRYSPVQPPSEEEEGLAEVTQLVAELHDFMDRFMRGKARGYSNVSAGVSSRASSPANSPTSARSGRSGPSERPMSPMSPDVDPAGE